MLSDATNGYVDRTQIYTGKNLEFTIEAGLSCAFRTDDRP